MGYRTPVRNLVAGLGRIWEDRPPEPIRREAYAVPCRCGQVAYGQRRTQHQVLRCLACGEPVFILPFSPYPGDVPHTAAHPRPAWHRVGWRLPILAGVLTLLAVIVVYVLLFAQLRGPTSALQGQDIAGQIEAGLAAGREALAQREFTEAARTLHEARRLYEQQKELIPASRGRELVQLHRQVDLLASRLPRPFELTLQRWAMLEPEELEKVFADARGTSVFFDLEMQRDGAGRYQYERRLGPELPELELHELKLLNRLPLQNTRKRVVFGARLAGLRRDAQNRFIVSFDPDSAVLVTDPEVAAVVVPPVEENLRVVLERQKDWATETP